MLKKRLREKKSLIRLFAFCAWEEKSLYNGNVDPTKLVKVLYAVFKQKLLQPS